ncbi:MAG: helix-turn-helix domain-containing protein [Candidatus Binatia bacterium]
MISCGRKLTAPQARLLLAIGQYDWYNVGGGCTASVPHLAREAGLSKRTAQRALEKLVKIGVLSRKRRSTRTGLQLADAMRINRAACVRLLPGATAAPPGCQPGERLVPTKTKTDGSVAPEVLAVNPLHETRTEETREAAAARLTAAASYNNDTREASRALLDELKRLSLEPDPPNGKGTSQGTRKARALASRVTP